MDRLFAVPASTTNDGGSLAAAVSAIVRAGRARLNLSQRELAERSGVSQCTIARIESGGTDPRLSWLVAVFGALELRLELPEVDWPTRMQGEYARDQAGRRLPAHLKPYRLERPHDWWPGITNILMWRNEPKWSYRRRWPEG